MVVNKFCRTTSKRAFLNGKSGPQGGSACDSTVHPSTQPSQEATHKRLLLQSRPGIIGGLLPHAILNANNDCVPRQIHTVRRMVVYSPCGYRFVLYHR